MTKVDDTSTSTSTVATTSFSYVFSIRIYIHYQTKVKHTAKQKPRLIARRPMRDSEYNYHLEISSFSLEIQFKSGGDKQVKDVNDLIFPS